MEVELNVQDYFLEWDSVADSLKERNLPLVLPIEDQTWYSWFHQWLMALQSDIPPAPSYEVSLRFSNDTEMQLLNAQYRQRNQPTDVLAFAALEVECPQDFEEAAEMPLYLGDIIISVDTASRQAQQQGHSLQTELAWLAAHGLLHLVGWDHPDDESLTRMLEQQVTLLHKIGIHPQWQLIE